MKKICIVVDMQHGFVQKNGTKELVPKIAKLLEMGVFDVVIATKFINGKHSVFENMLGWKGLVKEQEQEIPPAIMSHVDHVVEKHIYDCVNPDFIQLLCQLNDGLYPKEVFLVGVDTDCCVLSIATSLFEHNICPVVLTEYVYSNGGLKSHVAGLTCMKRLIGEKQLIDCRLPELLQVLQQT